MLFSRLTPGKVWGGFLAVVCLALLSMAVELPTVSAKDKTDIYEELKVFTDVLSIVKRDYVDKVEDSKLVEGAVKGMLAALDPHSGYLGPEFYQELQVETSGEFGGLGIEITLKDSLLVVVSPIEGSPAEAAGVKAGDKIIKIAGQFTKDLSLLDAVKKLRGPRGSPITISVFREGQADLLHFTIVRDVIQVRSVKGRYLENGFGYVRINQFQEKTGDDLVKAVEDLRKSSPGQEIAGLVLDFRNNPGGLLTQAIKVADLFLEEGVIVYTDGRVENQKKKFFAHKRGTEPPYPIVVLVNEGSASASEIVAGALKDHGRALVLGTKTFGKGSVQTILPLDNGGALRLTTALYFTKSGRSIQDSGIEPDIIMELPREEPVVAEKKPSSQRFLREKDLPGAIHNPSGIDEKNEPEEPRTTSPEVKVDKPISLETASLAELLKADPQLEKALDLLKTFNVFKAGDPASVAGAKS